MRWTKSVLPYIMSAVSNAEFPVNGMKWLGLGFPFDLERIHFSCRHTSDYCYWVKYLFFLLRHGLLALWLALWLARWLATLNRGGTNAIFRERN